MTVAKIINESARGGSQTKQFLKFQSKCGGFNSDLITYLWKQTCCQDSFICDVVESLAEGEWKPLNEGYDYLKMMDEDMEEAAMLHNAHPHCKYSRKFIFHDQKTMFLKNDIVIILKTVA